MFNNIYRNEAGILTFEWVLLLTILVIGVIAGLSSVRDSLNSELSDVSGAVLQVNQSFAVHQLDAKVNKAPGSINGEKPSWFYGSLKTDSHVNSQFNQNQMANRIEIKKVDLD